MIIMKYLIKVYLSGGDEVHAHSDEGNLLGDRTIIEHVRSASVFEVFDRDFYAIGLNPNVLTFKLKNEGSRTESLLMALHHSCTLDPVEDREMLLGILKKCAVWYCNYCDWEDSQDE